jgi:putative FmdB family regulatory protein
MPIYEYRCENGHAFEVMRAMTDDPLTACEVCDAPVERVFRPVAVHFKGSGFYTTDYARKGSADSGGEKSGDKSAESKSESKSETKSGDSGSESSKAETKSD